MWPMITSLVYPLFFLASRVLHLSSRSRCMKYWMRTRALLPSLQPWIEHISHTVSEEIKGQYRQ
jgi:hypothetical protein